MDLPTGVLRDLLQLSSYLDLDDDAVREPLISLVETIQTAVPSYRALQLTIVDIGHPVTLTAFVPRQDTDPITTSMRLGFAALSPGFDDQSRVVFYATTPGAFVDLAADFGYALDVRVTTGVPAGSTDRAGLCRPDQHDGDQRNRSTCCPRDRPIVLDVDLPPPDTICTGLVGLEELTMINRAVGILIDQGHHPDQAHAALLDHAATAGVRPHIYAARLLRR